MTDDAEDWIDDLVEEVKEAEELVKQLSDRKPAALSELMAVVRRDIERLDKELYGEKNVLEVTPGRDEGPDFTIISRARRGYAKMHVWLLPDEHVLMYGLFVRDIEDTKERERSTSTIKILPDYGGGITYEESYNDELTLAELSKLLIEPVVKAGSGLKFDRV